MSTTTSTQQGGGKKSSGGKSKTATRSGKGGQKPVVYTPPKKQRRGWVPKATIGGAIAAALLIVAYGAYAVYDANLTWQDRADKIKGIQNYRKNNPQILAYTEYKYGGIKYSMVPPVGGQSNPNYMRCQGDVYDAPIATEHAVHSMELGAVWITYRPNLPKKQIEQLAKRVRGTDFMLMSPFPDQDSPISLQTWGYQLKVKDAGDKRIDQFIKILRGVSSAQPSLTCTSGDYITETGTTPRDLPTQSQDQSGQMPGA